MEQKRPRSEPHGPDRSGVGRARRPEGGRRLRLLVPLLLALAVGACSSGDEEVAYSALKARVEAGEVSEVVASPFTVEAVPTEAARSAGAPERWVATPLPDDGDFVALLDAHGVTYSGLDSAGPSPAAIFGVVLAVFLILALVFVLQKRAAENASGVGKMRVRDATRDLSGIDFGDVAGADEAKAELEEVVAFLQDQSRFVRLGARIPKGVLLVGAPGTGKTLLARAVAGEAGVPFFSISGSEFVEVYVGVGAARVRRLFERAKAKAPCIIFIDELDAAGKSRGGGGAAGNDEREQTLNQLLVEMDGFEAQSGVIVMAATNRPEVLDAALLRPGRFDRQVVVDRPDRRGREAILRVHAERIRLGPDVDLGMVAARTPGFVGADLANLLNEAALLAARMDRPAVGMDEIDSAIDRIVTGLEKKNRLIPEKERRIVAYHEAGHAIVAERVETAEPVKKISIIPRGVGALGYMQQVPEERNLLQEDELLDRIAVLLGGRAAELVVFGKVSTGASNDLERATELARRMVAEFGMSDAVGPLNLVRRDSAFLPATGGASREHSEATARVIDEDVRRLVSDAFERAVSILRADQGVLETVAQRLLANDVMERDDLLTILEAPYRPPIAG